MRELRIFNEDLAAEVFWVLVCSRKCFHFIYGSTGNWCSRGRNDWLCGSNRFEWISWMLQRIVRKKDPQWIKRIMNQVYWGLWMITHWEWIFWFGYTIPYFVIIVLKRWSISFIIFEPSFHSLVCLENWRKHWTVLKIPSHILSFLWYNLCDCVVSTAILTGGVWLWLKRCLGRVRFTSLRKLSGVGGNDFLKQVLFNPGIALHFIGVEYL